ncbi:glutathione S-transferase T3-like [Raphanus sativus]|uniref:Glutathione S-transferase T3-like n=1 Tax=Raphanus sativus TaxID=3726 RepID=A0A9W3CAR3_RAPSA|nr:glutathione S-transferase T3-like [Raphanus sativus]
MDPKYPQSQSSSYVGLLHSQQGSVFHKNFPFESFHSSVNFGESDIPAFSSQQSQETPVDRVVRRKWTPADDDVLISVWLNTSKDPIIGNDQKSGTFWQRVVDYYAASPHGVEEGEKREPQQCRKRWGRINEHVNKFCGAYSAAERQHSSDENDCDVLKKAHDIFYSDHDHKFTLEHAWCVLRHEQKWRCLNPPRATGGSKRKNVAETSSTNAPDTNAPETNVAEAETRPEGIKAAKARRNGGKGKSVAEYASIWAMRKDDLEKKETLSKLAILDTLCAKKEPLTEAEEVVKNKLLAKYF